MKNALICMIFLIPIFCMSQGYPEIERQDTSYYKIMEKYNQYVSQFNLDHEDDSGSLKAENGAINKFSRWGDFWSSRMYVDGTVNKTGEHMVYNSLLNLEICETDEDDNKSWTNLGPISTDHLSIHDIGRVECANVNPLNSDDIIVGAANGGIWRSEITSEGNYLWKNVTDDGGFSIIGVTHIVRHPSMPNVLYAATGGKLDAWTSHSSKGHGIGVIFNEDFGETWTLTGLHPAQATTWCGGQQYAYAKNTEVLSLAIDPLSTENNTTIAAGGQCLIYSWNGDYKAGSENQEVWRCRTATQNDPCYISIPDLMEGGWSRMQDMLFDTDQNLWFTTLFGVFKIIKATDEIVSIGNFTPGMANTPLTIPFIDINDNGEIGMIVTHRYLEGSSQRYDNFYYLTRDNGMTWDIDGVEFSGSSSRRHYEPYDDDSEICLSPNNGEIIYYRNKSNNVVRAEFENNTMSVKFMQNNRNHVDIRFINSFGAETNDGTTDRLIMCDDGGVSRTNDGDYWEDITGHGLTCTNFFGLGVTDYKKDFYFCGAQDGSINFYNSGNWYQTQPGADNGECEIDYYNKVIEVSR